LKRVQGEDNEMRVVKVPRIKIAIDGDARQAAMSELCTTLDKVAEKKRDESVSVDEPVRQASQDQNESAV